MFKNILVAVFAILSLSAQAQTWTGSGNGSLTVDGDITGGASLAYNLPSANFSAQTWSFLTTATQAGTYTYDWTYSGNHAWFAVTAFLNSVTNGNSTSLVNAGPANCCSSPSNGFSYSGTTTFNVAAGDVYGFNFGGNNSDSNNFLTGTLSIAAVPEPSTYAMLLAGLGMLGFAARRKRV